MTRLLAAILVIGLPGCATVITGTSQRVAVETVPAGARCTLSRGLYAVATIASTPGVVEVHKGSTDLNVACTKPGYQVAQQVVPTGLQGWLLGNAVVGGLIGVAVDFTSGAAFQYDPGTMLALQAMPYTGMPYASLPDGYAGRRQRSRGSSNPLVVAASTPNGDVTYVWGRSGS